MKTIPKLQTAWQPLQVDNTRVQKPIVIQPIKRTLKPGETLLNLGKQQTVITPKQVYVQQDSRLDKQRKSDQKYAQQKRKQIELDKAQKRTGEVAGAFLERTMPSYWAQQLTNESLNPMQQFLIDGFSPGKVIKGGLSLAALSPAIKATSVKKIFDPNRWFKLRNPQYVTQRDIKTLESFLPEYKNIQEKALDEGNYMIVSKGFPGSKQLEDGRYIFQGDEGSWIQSQSKNFKAKFGDKTLKIGYKGGTDQKAIEGGIQEHAPETFPEQDKGIFFAADKRYADKYNHGTGETPGFWLGFSKPYDMINGGQRPFLLESEAIRYMRSIDAMPSFKSFPDKPFEILGNIWGDLSYLKNPKIMSIITKDPNKMTAAELAERVKILSKIRAGQNNNNMKQFGRMVDANVKSGRWQPLRSTHYDGYIGRDHSLRWSSEYDPMEPFGSHPESYVITKPEQASILVGNNGSFNGPAYSRKHGGKLKFKIK